MLVEKIENLCCDRESSNDHRNLISTIEPKKSFMVIKPKIEKRGLLREGCVKRDGLME